MNNDKRKPKTGARLKRPYKTDTGVVMLTDRQKAFGDAVVSSVTSGDLLRKAAEIYQTADDETARVITSENLRKPNIIEYLGNRGYKALDVLNEAMTDEEAKWSDRIAAANSVADRQFGKATQRVESSSTTVKISIDLTQTEA